jgi:uncharacterized Zn-finger protein
VAVCANAEIFGLVGLHFNDDERVILGERPYKCHLPDCGRAFIQLSNLQQHLRNHDAQVERAKNRPFHCNICGKGFATESSLRTHTSKVGSSLRISERKNSNQPDVKSLCFVCYHTFANNQKFSEYLFKSSAAKKFFNYFHW